MRPFITGIGAGLLVLSYVTVSDARTHAQRPSPTQSAVDYNRLDYDAVRDRDSSCFSRATGLPTSYACSSNGG
jgi:hypothetical protein